MKKTMLFLTMILSVGILSGCGSSSDTTAKPDGTDVAQVCNKTECFKVDIAKTSSEQIQGLMGVEEMPADEGMLFVFDNPGVHEFWMKNTLIPLDMIWIDENLEVVYVKEYAAPCSAEDSEKNTCQLFGPPEGTLAKYVLEVNANKTREAGIFEGVKVDLYNVN